MLHRDDEIGSLAEGKYADLVELSMDPYVADPLKLASQVKVQGTWRGGRKVDLDAFMTQIEAVEAAGTHPVDHATPIKSHTC